jgi:hypothetical protein
VTLLIKGGDRRLARRRGDAAMTDDRKTRVVIFIPNMSMTHTSWMRDEIGFAFSQHYLVSYTLEETAPPPSMSGELPLLLLVKT